MSATMTAKRERDELLERYRELRDGGARPIVLRQAYNEWFTRCCNDGVPPDALSMYSPDEAERFWARTVSGPDGHIYWVGGLEFKRNDGKERRPQRWAWSKAHGELDPMQEIANTCGEANCVNAEHMRLKDRGESRVRFPDHKAFNALKVIALQQGRTPSALDWDTAKPGITSQALIMRFGKWSTFVQRAGLVPRAVQEKATREQCEAAVLAMAERLGRRPNSGDWDREREWLRENGHPTSSNTISKRIGLTFAQSVTAVLAKSRKAA